MKAYNRSQHKRRTFFDSTHELCECEQQEPITREELVASFKQLNTTSPVQSLRNLACSLEAFAYRIRTWAERRKGGWNG